MTRKLDVVGQSEIADLLGVSRQRVDQIRRADPTFPEAAAQVRGTRIWRRVDVDRWARKSGRVT